MSIAIGLLSCANDATEGNCSGDGADSQIGRILTFGPYAPKSVPGTFGLVQNYTVTVPANFPKGPAALSVAHYFLLGDQTVRALCRCRSERVVLNVMRPLDFCFGAHRNPQRDHQHRLRIVDVEIICFM